MENGLFEASTVNNVQDVNGCVFRVFSSCKGDKMPSSALDDSLLYPSIIVRNLNDLWPSIAVFWDSKSGSREAAVPTARAGGNVRFSDLPGGSVSCLFSLT